MFKLPFRRTATQDKPARLTDAQRQAKLDLALRLLNVAVYPHDRWSGPWSRKSPYFGYTNSIFGSGKILASKVRVEQYDITLTADGQWRLRAAIPSPHTGYMHVTAHVDLDANLLMVLREVDRLAAFYGKLQRATTNELRKHVQVGEMQILITDNRALDPLKLPGSRHAFA